MVFASSLISVEKNRAGPGVAGAPKKLDRCGVKHEIVALILTAIRASVRKRRKPERPYRDSCNLLIVNDLERRGTYALFCITSSVAFERLFSFSAYRRQSPRGLFFCKAANSHGVLAFEFLLQRDVPHGFQLCQMTGQIPRRGPQNFPQPKSMVAAG